MTTLNLRAARRFALVSIVVLAALPCLSAEKLPEKDLRAAPPKTLNTLRTFPAIKSRAEWESRAQAIREQVLVSCGLWPLPAKTPLKPVVTGKVVHGDYSVEPVHIQTYPGFYL